jgi:acyl-homoserine lactone acylase PvdQ
MLTRPLLIPPTLVVLFLFAVVAVRPNASAADLPGAGHDGDKIVVYRDAWGVPHIYAPTVEGGMYAMGWAQAQDRPEQLLRNLARGLGEISTADGPAGIQSDVVAKTFRLYDSSVEHLELIDEPVRKQTQAFVNGINAWYAQHPEDVPEWWGNRQVDEAMIVAFGRLFLHGWSIDDGFGDLKRADIEPGFDKVERGSNQWAIAPQRSANGAAILYIDPHLSWFGPSRFWEFRIHAGDLHGSGFTLAGQNFIGLGHNEHVAWAMTTGGPDTADIYELTLNPENPTQYMYDGQSRDFKISQIEIKVKGMPEPIKQPMYESHHGPVVALRGGKAYAHKMAYAEQVEGAEAWQHLGYAKDYTGAVDAMATLQVFPQNVMVADTSGNIYYQRTGRVPIRPDGFDWSKPVDGSISASEWQGFHPSSDFVQLLNPPQGFMQNCNNAPDAMLVNGPIKASQFKPYLFTDVGYGSQQGGWQTSRGARALQLLDNDNSVTVEEALDYALDVHPYGVERWLQVLKMADQKFGDTLASDPGYQAAIKDLSAWDGDLDHDSSAALKYTYWRQQLVADHGADAVQAADEIITNLQASFGGPRHELQLSDAELNAAVESLAGAMQELKADWGSYDAVYGDKFRVGRDDKSWPVGGGGDEGTRTLRSVGYEKERADHTRWGRSGQTSTQIVVMTKPVRSWTFVPIGQSDRPESPHYTDQAEQLFSRRQMKPTWWLPQELAGHIESRTVLAP